MSYQEQYDSVIEEYLIDLSKNSQEIEYNHERVGVIIFQDISFDCLGVIKRNNNLVLLGSLYGRELLTIKNWYKHNNSC